MPKKRDSALIIGAGQLGRAIAVQLQSQFHRVGLVSRRAHDLPENLEHHCADIVSGAGVAQLPASVDALIICVAPDVRDAFHYRQLFIEGVGRVLQHSTSQQLLAISSTAVYAQDQGQWVDERSPAEATTFNGRVLCEYERLCEQHSHASILRLSGLYGGQQPPRLLEKARRGELGDARWSNRIHREDAALAAAHVAALPEPEAMYCVSDSCPVRNSELLAFLREPSRTLAGLPHPHGGASSGRRVSNARLLGSGWQPKYPSFREGYGPYLTPTDV